MKRRKNKLEIVATHLLYAPMFLKMLSIRSLFKDMPTLTKTSIIRLRQQFGSELKPTRAEVKYVETKVVHLNLTQSYSLEQGGENCHF